MEIKKDKTVRVSLLVLVVLASLAALVEVFSPDAKYRGLGFAIFMMFIVGGEGLVLLIVAASYGFSGDRQRGKTYLLAAGLVLLIGCSLCFGGVALAEQL